MPNNSQRNSRKRRRNDPKVTTLTEQKTPLWLNRTSIVTRPLRETSEGCPMSRRWFKVLLALVSYQFCLAGMQAGGTIAATVRLRSKLLRQPRVRLQHRAPTGRWRTAAEKLLSPSPLTPAFRPMTFRPSFRKRYSHDLPNKLANTGSLLPRGPATFSVSTSLSATKSLNLCAASLVPG
jgi:hypothetical protein